jgi:hypothetical protein
MSRRLIPLDFPLKLDQPDRGTIQKETSCLDWAVPSIKQASNL